MSKEEKFSRGIKDINFTPIEVGERYDWSKSLEDLGFESLLLQEEQTPLDYFSNPLPPEYDSFTDEDYRL